MAGAVKFGDPAKAMVPQWRVRRADIPREARQPVRSISGADSATFDPERKEKVCSCVDTRRGLMLATRFRLLTSGSSLTIGRSSRGWLLPIRTRWTGWRDGASVLRRCHSLLWTDSIAAPEDWGLVGASHRSPCASAYMHTCEMTVVGMRWRVPDSVCPCPTVACRAMH